MTINEALAKISTLKGDLKQLEAKLSQNMTVTTYIGVDEKYYPNIEESQANENALLSDITVLISQIHDLKLSIQETNYKYKINYMIQELDYWKTICALLNPFRNCTKQTVPQLDPYMRTTQVPVYTITRANFDVDAVERLYQTAVEKINTMKNAIQTLNCQTQLLSIKWFEGGDNKLR